MMAKLFKKSPLAEKKSIRIEIRMTANDANNILFSAKIRGLSMSDFIRCAALGRRADVHFEMEIILALREVVKSVRGLHATFIAEKTVPPQHELGVILDAALAAMLRINM